MQCNIFHMKTLLILVAIITFAFFCLFVCFMIHKVFEKIENEHRMMITEMTGDGFWLTQAKSLFAVRS